MVCWLGLPVGNIPLGENPSTVHLNVERTASLPVPQQLNIGFGATRQFTSQFRPNASPDTGMTTTNYFIIYLVYSNTILFHRIEISRQYAIKCISRRKFGRVGHN